MLGVPVHEVELDTFYIARTPVTNTEYARYLRANPDAPEPRPVFARLLEGRVSVASAGTEHGPIGVEALVGLRSERKIDSSTLVREEGGQPKPFYELDLKAEIEHAQHRNLRVMLAVLAVGLVAFACLFVAIFADSPVSLTALALFLLGALWLAFVAGRYRQVGLSVTATLIPAAVGMMATIQHPALLEPLAPLVCEAGETLVSTSERTQDPTRWQDPTASEVTAFATACATSESSRRTFLPMFAHGLVLFALFGVSNRVGRHVFGVEA